MANVAAFRRAFLRKRSAPTSGTTPITDKKPLSLLDMDEDQVSNLVREVVDSWHTQLSGVSYDPRDKS